jgi:hypothetical protein
MMSVYLEAGALYERFGIPASVVPTAARSAANGLDLRVVLSFALL